MRNSISITSIASVSALGSLLEDIWTNYKNDKHHLSIKEFDNFNAWVAKLQEKDKLQIEKLRKSDAKYKDLDESVLYALYVSRKAIKEAGWSANDDFGINIGSSRGATILFEKYHKEFLQTGKSSTLSSPTTTLGNISSWIAHDLQTSGPEISHSITCSTGLHSLLNGVAWIQSGMASKFLIGASEASLTDFTIAQMQALKVYAKNEDEYPCKTLDLEKNNNTMVIGEGASVICLEEGIKENAIAYVEGVGYATEILKHNISISSDAQCFQKSMKMALGDVSPKDIDAIVMHAPGTIKGDLSELKAIEKIFGEHKPFLTSNKWKLGHTFATSGLLSLELGILMLQHQEGISVPFIEKQKCPAKINKILVNSVGFGGNAVSILITK
ncbi:3-oxoacyl-(acyl-carrier-protein) synthase [Tenacibaculum sp. MAR_2010_89]|uniref:beta-ketoacyl synthase N-terminal-like domain-containing protein n=1 Tax=Tenacibaculum sp. MAR_2010_89 TaxID=1250198 RepID=UPI0008966ADF|nr:beta-ketoacyl synthase N-terminal-like domain-containing protein [Tenacibaculum sp. MAR_2010_89]SED91814.1 3-oxoacyl-(acyl-carrier-protein) synthase [Tenacibaculum sp. MAR_2010_89]